MYQFFVEASQITEQKVIITGNDVNHIKNVLRMKIGEEIAVSNGVDGREYRCGIAKITEDAIICELRFIKEEALELPTKLYLFQGLPKSDKMELIIQKAVELGAYEIIPVATKRAIMKLDAKKEKNKLTRWQAISEAAAKQSKRGIIPNIHGVMSFKEAIDFAEGFSYKIIPYECSEGMERTKEIMQEIGEKKPESVAIFIGPEGGFAPEEIDYAREKNVEPITLGKRILRTETAGFTTLAFLMYQLEG